MVHKAHHKGHGCPCPMCYVLLCVLDSLFFVSACASSGGSPRVQRRRRGGCQPPKNSQALIEWVELVCLSLCPVLSIASRVMQWLFTRGRGGGCYLIYFPTVGKLALVGWVWLLLTSQCTRLAFRLLPRSLGCCTHVRSSRAGSYAWAIWPTDLLELLKSRGFPTVGKPVEEDLSSSKFECTTSGRGCQIEMLGGEW